MRPHAIVQPKQAWLVTSCFLPSLSRGVAIASAPMSLAPSNWLSRWLRVGSAPSSLITLISTWVPYVGRPWPVTAFSARIFFFSKVTRMNSLGLAMLPTPIVPRTAIAFRFLLPITAPTPERPAARCRSLTTAAYNTWFSPASPIELMRSCGSWCCFFSIASVSKTLLPHRWAASFSSAWPSLIDR